MLSLTRRSFVSLLACGSAALALPGLALADEVVAASAVKDGSVVESSNGTWRIEELSDGSLAVTDMWGNEVTLPGTVKKIYSSSPIGTYMDYVLNPELLIGWNSQLSDEALQFINEDYRDLQVLGGSSNNDVDVEYVVSLEPDVIVAYGEVGGSISDTIKTLSEQTDIPILFLDSRLLATSDALLFLGHLTDNVERAEELAAYIDEKLQMVADLGASVPEDERKTVYYETSDDGLSTAGSNSMHTEVLELIGLENVAGDDETYTQGSTVSLENVLAWDPDVILCYNQDFYESVFDNDDWSDVAAVKNGEVYPIPTLPFNWFDRPPCVARVIGAEYVLAKVYPDYVDFDLIQEVIDYYGLFYQVDITEEQAASLVEG